MATTIKDLESRMCRPLYCDICRIRLSGPAPAQQHYSSKNHVKKAEVLLRIHDFETFDIKNDEYFCKSCRMAYNSKDDLDDHLQSMEHREMCQTEENPLGCQNVGAGNIFLNAIQNGVDAYANVSPGMVHRESNLKTGGVSSGTAAGEKSIETINASPAANRCIFTDSDSVDNGTPRVAIPSVHILSAVVEASGAIPGDSDVHSETVENDVMTELSVDKEYELLPSGRGRCFICKVVLTSSKLAREHLNGKNHKKAHDAWLLRKHCTERSAKDLVRFENSSIREASGINPRKPDDSKSINQVVPKPKEILNSVTVSYPATECKRLQEKDAMLSFDQNVFCESLLLSLRSEIGDDTNDGTEVRSVCEGFNANAKKEDNAGALNGTELIKIKELEKASKNHPKSDHLLSQSNLAKDDKGCGSIGVKNVNLLANAVDKSIQCPSLNLLTPSKVAVGSERDRKVRKGDSSDINKTASTLSRTWNEGPLCGISLNETHSKQLTDSEMLASIWTQGDLNSNKVPTKVEFSRINPGLDAFSLTTDESFSQKTTRPSLRCDINDQTRVLTTGIQNSEINLSERSRVGQLGLTTLINFSAALGLANVQSIENRSKNCPGSENEGSVSDVDEDKQLIFEELIRTINNYALIEDSVDPVTLPYVTSSSTSYCVSPSYNGTNLSDPVGSGASDVKMEGLLPNKTSNKHHHHLPLSPSLTGLTGLTNILNKSTSVVSSTVTNENVSQLSKGPKLPLTTPPGFRPLDQFSAVSLPNGSAVSFDSAARNLSKNLDEVTANSIAKSPVTPWSADRTVWHQCNFCGKKLNSEKQLEVHMSSHGGLAELNLKSMSQTLSSSQADSKTG